MKVPSKKPASAPVVADTRASEVRFGSLKKIGWMALVHHLQILLLVCVGVAVGAATAGSNITLPFSVLGVGLAAMVIMDASSPDRRLHAAYVAWKATIWPAAAMPSTGRRPLPVSRVQQAPPPPKQPEPRRQARFHEHTPAWRPWHRKKPPQG